MKKCGKTMGMFPDTAYTGDIVGDSKIVFSQLDGMGLDEKVDAINKIREALSEYSPFKSEPVDCVKWVKNDTVRANNYNPNSVAPPEMELLAHSIMCDGYTQPIVSWEPKENEIEVIDGFHRHRVGKEVDEVRDRVHSYLPVVTIKEDREGENDRMASTVRHNRARGKHSVESMSEIVMDLKKRNWSDKRIGKEMGMDEDEVLRLCQLTGMTEVFADVDFSRAWDVGIFDEESSDFSTDGDNE